MQVEIPETLGSIACKANIACLHYTSMLLCGSGVVWDVKYNNCKQIPGNRRIVQISSGAKHVALLDYYGKVYTMGSNEQEQLGVPLELKVEAIYPSEVPGLPFITYVACGESFTCCISQSKDLWNFGDNSSHQLGIEELYEEGNEYWNQIEGIGEVMQVPNVADAISVHCGRCHCFVRTKSGILACGNNAEGQLGNSDCTEMVRFAPVLTSFPDGQTITSIECGSLHSVFLTEEGTVYGCGAHSVGETGIAVAELHKIPKLQNIEQIACQQSCTFALDDQGDLWMCGDLCGEAILSPVKICDIDEPIEFIGRGFAKHTIVQCQSGALWNFGANDKGQLAVGHEKANNVPPVKLAEHDLCGIGDPTDPNSLTKQLVNRLSYVSLRH